MNLINIQTKHLLTLLLMLSSSFVSANNVNPAQEVKTTAQKMVHILDYVALEYANVVNNGVITNQGEYEEQQEFSDQLLLLVDSLPQAPGVSVLKVEARQISASIRQHADGKKVTALCNSLSLRLIDQYKVGVAPRVVPSLENAANLFQENCASCHGMQGYGDGPGAVGLDPAPANFHDRNRQQHHSVFSFYNTISLGVNGTAMVAFENLNSQQRWQLAFYVSNFFAIDTERAKGKTIAAEMKSPLTIRSLAQLTQSTPAQIQAKSGEAGLAELAYLRANPTELQKHTIAPLQVAADSLHNSVVAYQKGDTQAAYDLAVAAYLEGFELVERRLQPADPELREQIEKGMLQYRDMIKNRATLSEIQNAQTELGVLLTSAHEKLQASNLSSSVNFLSALLILLREGIEAILILAAISAVLIKTGRSEMMRYLHFGWISALILGVLTWFVAGHFISVSGASREMTEGITALIAAVMLIYVGFWLHKQTYAMHWQDYIRNKVSKSLTDSAMTGMTVVAFIAVYREVFESILFFNTLWLQTNAEGHTQIMFGAITSVVMLALIAWGIFKFSVRLPLKLFFSVNSIFLYLLAIVFAGKGIAALQEAGKLRVDPVNFFEVRALGIFPNLETLGVQVIMIGVAILLYVVSRNRLNRVESQP